MKRTLAAIILLLIIAGCTQPEQTSNNQGAQEVQGDGAGKMEIVEKGDTVKAEYAGTLPDGNIFDKSAGRGPLEFNAGKGQMIPGFDEAVLGMKLNEEKSVTIPPEKAYGQIREDSFVWVPKTQLPQDGNVSVGTQLLAANGMPVKVVDVNADSAKIDFNHPLAGKALKFWIKIVGITKGQR